MVTAPVAATGGVSTAALTGVIVGLVVWAALFVWMVLRRGLTPLIALIDAAVVGAVLLIQGHIVPFRSVADGTTWVLMLASTAVFIPQLTFRPVIGLPAAVPVTAAYVVGAPGPMGATFLIIQAVVTSALMTLLRRGGHRADQIIAHSTRTRQAVRARSARRADEREQYRRLHDTVLSTLTMVASGAFEERSAALSAKASEDLHVLGGLGSVPGFGGDTVPLGERLRKVVAEASDLRTVDLRVTAPMLPAQVADRLAECVAEALRNVARHAGVDAATVRADSTGAGVVIEIVDHGCGFDPARIPAARRGVRESIQGRVEAVGGRAEVESRPGEGTRITLRWPDA
jgi:signal transduction histidine kinase